jgi:hypothetical protein
MIKKIINIIKSWFTSKEEMDEHAELYLKVPEPEIPVHEEPEEWKCDTHNRYKKSCPVCRDIKGIA